MGITTEQREMIRSKFESLFEDPKMLGQALHVENPPLYETMVNDILKEERFDNEATHENVQHDLLVQSKRDSSEWADDFIESHNIETTDDFDAVVNDDDVYYAFIFGTINSTDIELELYQEPNEWLDQNPTADYFAQEMKQHFDEVYLEELIKESDDEYAQKVREAMLDDGFPSNTPIEDLDVKVDASLKGGDMTVIAEKYVDTARESGGVIEYLNGNFYSDLLIDNMIDYNIRILSDVEDFK